MNIKKNIWNHHQVDRWIFTTTIFSPETKRCLGGLSLSSWGLRPFFEGRLLLVSGRVNTKRQQNKPMNSRNVLGSCLCFFWLPCSTMPWKETMQLKPSSVCQECKQKTNKQNKACHYFLLDWLSGTHQTQGLSNLKAFRFDVHFGRPPVTQVFSGFSWVWDSPFLNKEKQPSYWEGFRFPRPIPNKLYILHSSVGKFRWQFFSLPSPRTRERKGLQGGPLL